MTRKQAIKAIKLQKERISEYGDGFLWISTTLSYFEAIFGKGSREYDLLKSWYHCKPTNASEIEIKKWEAGNDMLAKTLDAAIEAIKLKGVISTPQNNFIETLTNKEIIGYLTAIIVAAFSLGLFLGKVWHVIQPN